MALFKVCDANFWSCECPKHQPWNLKKVGFPSLSPRTQKNGSLTSRIFVISHQKGCKWRWLKVCDDYFWSCECTCPKHQHWNLKKGGFQYDPNIFGFTSLSQVTWQQNVISTPFISKYSGLFLIVGISKYSGLFRARGQTTTKSKVFMFRFVPIFHEGAP